MSKRKQTKTTVYSLTNGKYLSLNDMSSQLEVQPKHIISVVKKHKIPVYLLFHTKTVFNVEQKEEISKLLSEEIIYAGK